MGLKGWAHGLSFVAPQLFLAAKEAWRVGEQPYTTAKKRLQLRQATTQVTKRTVKTNYILPQRK